MLAPGESDLKSNLPLTRAPTWLSLSSAWAAPTTWWHKKKVWVGDMRWQKPKTLAWGKRARTFGRESVWKEEGRTIQATSVPRPSSHAPKPTWVLNLKAGTCFGLFSSQAAGAFNFNWLASSRILTGAKSNMAPLFNLTTIELSCMGGGMVNLSSIVHSSLLNMLVTLTRSASTVSRAFGPSLAAPARTFFLTFTKITELSYFLFSLPPFS